MSEEKIYQFNEYVLGYDKGENDRSALTISKVLNGNMYVMETLTDESADVISLMLDELNKELQQKENIIKEVREKIESVQIFGLRSEKTLIASLLNDILEILDKGEQIDDSKRNV